MTARARSTTARRDCEKQSGTKNECVPKTDKESQNAEQRQSDKENVRLSEPEHERHGEPHRARQERQREEARDRQEQPNVEDKKRQAHHCDELALVLEAST